MKIINNFRVCAMVLFIAIGIVACNKPGNTETAGQKIDEASTKAGEKMDQATEKLAEQGRKTEEATAKAGDKMNQATEKLSEQGKNIASVVDDATITSKVKAAIFSEPALKSMQINVATTQGVVTLSGSADSLPDSDRASELARAVAGVTGVDNRLVVKSTP